MVIGNSQLENFWRAENDREFQRFKGRLTFVWLNELSFEEILKRSAALPPNSVIYYQLLGLDAKGVSHAEARVLRDLHAVANAPIFGLQGYQLGEGVVGGPLLAIDDLSRSAAGAGLRIMDGESPEHGGWRRYRQGPRSSTGANFATGASARTAFLRAAPCGFASSPRVGTEGMAAWWQPCPFVSWKLS